MKEETTKLEGELKESPSENTGGLIAGGGKKIDLKDTEVSQETKENADYGKEGMETQVVDVIGGKETQINTNGQVVEVEERKEQERTTIMKKLFLEEFPKQKMVVRRTCAKIGIDHLTFYKWKEKDPVFFDAFIQAKSRILDELEDTLAHLALVDKDGPSVRYMLDRRHPLYKPRVTVDGPVAGQMSAEREMEEMIFTDVEVMPIKEDAKPNNTTEDGGAKAEEVNR